MPTKIRGLRVSVYKVFIEIGVSVETACPVKIASLKSSEVDTFDTSMPSLACFSKASYVCYNAQKLQL